MNFRKQSNQTELDRFFQHYLGLNDDVQHVTKSAFFQARNKLSHTPFIDLNRQFIEDVYRQKQHIKTWQGCRLCAIDGSSIRLPDEPAIRTYFGTHGGRKKQIKCVMGMTSIFYDVMNHIAIDSRLEKNKTSERQCAAKHLEFSQKKDLVLYDRGYPAHWLYKLHQQRHIKFCMRIKTNQTVVKRFIKSGKKDQLTTFHASPIARKRCKEEGVSSASIKLRLVRVDLPSGVEVLVTNLGDDRAYPSYIFKSLYHLRWGIEENYKRLKQWVEIENFSGKSVRSIKQDFYAKILATNLSVLVAKAAQEKIEKKAKDRRIKYQINFAQVLSKMKHRLIVLIADNQQRQAQIIQAINYISQTIEAVRKGRSSPRNLKNIKNNIHYSSYKCTL